ncbi:MAG: cell division protein FtsQ/DivIB [Roseobacter sp.]
MRSLTRRNPKERGSDPAPSRWAWRIERLMLTPAFLIFLRAGVPMAMVLGGAVWWLADEDRRALVTETVKEARASFETRPEFMVQVMAIDGADHALALEIRTAVPLDFPVSSFDLTLSDIREKIVALDPVKSATIRIKPGGELHVDVSPRTPVVIWRGRDGLALFDVSGARVGDVADRMERPDLPLIAGGGATEHVKEALDLYRAAAPLGGRLRGIVRKGQRRWDIVLDRDQRILLPETEAVQALERVIALDGAQDILGRDVKRVDLRIGARPTIKMSKYATDTWWDIRKISGQ